MAEKNMKLIKTPFSKENPILVQVLGICSTLAVTVKLQPSVVMALSVMVVVMMANLIISLMRNTIHHVSVSLFSWWLLHSL